MREAELLRYLESWAVLNESLMQLDESACHDLLKLEKAGANRPLFLFRIYGRYNKLRGARERDELLGNTAPKRRS